MRIISGYLRGRNISQPNNQLTRPLKDLTKESIFNILKHSNLIMINFEKSKRSPLNPFLIVDNLFDESFFSNLNMEMASELIGNVTMGGRINNEFLPKNHDSKKYKSWHQFYEFINSSELRNHLQQEYSDDLEYWDANIDFLNPSLKPIIHWATSWDDYWRETHFDTEGRLWSFIIFFNDKQWDGGDLNLHNDSNVAFHVPRYFLKKLPINLCALPRSPETLPLGLSSLLGQYLPPHSFLWGYYKGFFVSTLQRQSVEPNSKNSH